MLNDQPVPQFLRHRSAGEVQPALIGKRAQLVGARRPDQDRRSVGHEPESLLALAQRMFGTRQIRDVQEGADSASRLAILSHERRRIADHVALGPVAEQQRRLVAEHGHAVECGLL